MDDQFVIGIDVGSAEVRCALVNCKGYIVRVGTKRIDIYSPDPGYFQQSSLQIWSAVVNIVREITEGVDKEKIKGIGCDATCSLVLIGKDGKPVTVSPKGEQDQNVIMWMDHRAEKQAEFINNFDDPLLGYLGGKVSLEMQMPKIKWLKENLLSSFKETEKYFDLPDFLVWKLTGVDTRSQCSLVCKWMYEGSPNTHSPGWNVEFLKKIGLEELCLGSFSKIGNNVAMPGQRVGGVSPQAAEELGLNEGTAVAASLIDAHAGTLGLIASKIPSSLNLPITNKLGMICGTSSCFMLLSERDVKVDGVWGPYYGAVLEHLWLSEGGQSAAGQLLDRLVQSHPAKPETSDPGQICSVMRRTLEIMAKSKGRPVQQLTQHFHVYPDFRGNRSPLADPSLRGMISGLDINSDEEQLAMIYLAALQGLAYSARQTIEKLESKDLGPIKCLVICGGLTKNGLFMETLAGALGRLVVIPKTSESVLLGSAMLAAAACSLYPSLTHCAEAMSSDSDIVEVSDQHTLRYHKKKYEVYLKMQADQLAYKDMMS